MSKASDKLELAKGHLERVQSAWDDPTDWDDLSLYGFYCLEAAVEAAALHVRMATSKKHWEKVEVAAKLSKKHKLPDIADLLRDLNQARKFAAYGDVSMPDLDPEEVAIAIEEYVEAVDGLLAEE